MEYELIMNELYMYAITNDVSGYVLIGCCAASLLCVILVIIALLSTFKFSLFGGVIRFRLQDLFPQRTEERVRECRKEHSGTPNGTL